MSQTRRSLTLIAKNKENNLVVRETTVPPVGQDDVLIDVKFCGLNFAEVSMRQGLYSPMPSVPFVPGYECSGIVEQIGPGVTDVQVGDRVMAVDNLGSWQDKVVVSKMNCIAIPKNLSLQEAAAIPVNYLTAAIMLFDMAVLRPKQSVFVHMAAGGVGTAVGQLCRTVPDVTVYGTASASKHKHCVDNGITHPIDYRTTDYVKHMNSLGVSGVDIMLDPVGGSESKRSHNLLNPLGTHIHYGGSSYVTGESFGFSSMLNLAKNFLQGGSYSGFSLMDKNVMVGGLHVGRLVQDQRNFPIVRRQMENLMEMAAEGTIKPVIDSVFHFEDIKEAMGRIYNRLNVGKVILNASPKPSEPTEEK